MPTLALITVVFSLLFLVCIFMIFKKGLKVIAHPTPTTEPVLSKEFIALSEKLRNKQNIISKSSNGRLSLASGEVLWINENFQKFKVYSNFKFHPTDRELIKLWKQIRNEVINA